MMVFRPGEAENILILYPENILHEYAANKTHSHNKHEKVHCDVTN